MLSKTFLATIILLILCMETTAWRRRRRRRRCPTNSCSWHWGPCSKNCGGGTQTAIKTAKQGACGSCNMPTAAQRCNTHCCPSNCQWNAWGAWGSCSRTCGSGTQTRSRGQRAPLCGGSACSGPRTETRSCNTKCCPTHCSWAAWGTWTSCPKKCGGGSQTRNRGHAVTGSCGGNACSGSSSESRKCSQIKACDARATCINSKGGYDCRCDRGFRGSGFECTDVDECVIGNHGCTGLFEECVNTIGGHKCGCVGQLIRKNGQCEEPVPVTSRHADKDSSA